MDFNEDDTLAIGQLKKFARLYMARKAIRRKDKELTKQLADMQIPLIDHLLEHDLTTLPLKGGRTIYMQPRIDPKYRDEKYTREDIIEAMQKDGLNALVSKNFNSQQLASYLKELYDNDQKLPEHLDEIIEMVPTTNLVVRGS